MIIINLRQKSYDNIHKEWRIQIVTNEKEKTQEKHEERKKV